MKLGLAGLPTRSSAWSFLWISAALAVGFGLYGFVDSRFFLGVGLSFAALWYWLAIKWVDAHGGWVKSAAVAPAKPSEDPSKPSAAQNP